MTYQHRSARRFARPSRLFRWAQAEGFLDPPGRALVVGAGLLVEALALLEMGWAVDALETVESVHRRPELYRAFSERARARVLTSVRPPGLKYRLVLITHVLEFVEHPAERLALLRDVADRLTTDGQVLISLRGWSDVRAAAHATPSGDGVVTGLGTWTRGFSVAEAKELLAAIGLTVVASPNPRSSTPEQVRLICQLTTGERQQP
jgi:hypothetical protein